MGAPVAAQKINGVLQRPWLQPLPLYQQARPCILNITNSATSNDIKRASFQGFNKTFTNI